MVGTHTTLRFARQDDYTLSLLARVQRETGYVPTMEELTQLLQCPTTAAARQCLDELVASGEGTRLTPTEQHEMAEIAEQILRNEAHCAPHRQLDAHNRRRSRTTDRSHVRWASAGQEDLSSASS